MTLLSQAQGYVLAAMMIAAPAFAADEYNVSSGVTTEGAPLGLHGVDAVALVKDKWPTAGAASFTATHDNVAYYFASAESMAAFQANPEAYLPQFGGFCAFAVSLGKKFDGDPRYADIRDGKLYLFVNADVFAAYKKDPEGILAKASATWPSIQHSAVSDL